MYFLTPLMEELHFGTFELASLEECDESRPLEKRARGRWAGQRWRGLGRELVGL